jgi:hypothetical protein
VRHAYPIRVTQTQRKRLLGRLRHRWQDSSIRFEVMLPSVCSCIVDGSRSYVWLSLFYTTCFGLHGHLHVSMMFYFYIPEGICFAAFVALSCTWLYYARLHLCFSVVFFRSFSDSCVRVSLLPFLVVCRIV